MTDQWLATDNRLAPQYIAVYHTKRLITCVRRCWELLLQVKQITSYKDMFEGSALPWKKKTHQETGLNALIIITMYMYNTDIVPDEFIFTYFFQEAGVVITINID